MDFADLARADAALHAFADFDPAAAGGSGPLAGLSVGVKANIAVRGLPWTGGMAHRRAVRAEADAAVVAALRQAGAAICGTLNMHEAALGATTDNAHYGRTHNPYRQGFTPGGSSGGSGAAVAARLCDAALGTDTLGSIRIPAAYCGVFGLKPTLGAVPVDGLLLLDPAFDVIGPLAADLDRLAQVWAVIGRDHGPGAFARMVVPADRYGVACQPAVVTAHEAALAAVGLPPTELALPAEPTTIRLAALAQSARALAAWLAPDELAKASAELRGVLAALLRVEQRPALLTEVRALLVDTLGDDGVLVLPTTPHAAFAHGTRPPASQADFTVLASVAGLPALAVPAGCDADGLPVSVQLVGPAGSETRLIDLARQLLPALPPTPPAPQPA